MPEYYIFNGDVVDEFYKKLDFLHDKHVRHLIMNGMADKGTGLESVKMTKNPEATEKFCQKVVGGLTNVPPKIIVRLMEDGEVRLECIFTWLTDGKYLKNELFMVQSVVGWLYPNKFSCQIWYLGQIKESEVIQIWN